MNKTIKTAVAATAVVAGSVLGAGAATAAPAPGPAVVQAADPCPVCGLGDYGNDDGGAAALAEHLFQNHFAEWLRTQARTGSAG